MRKAKVESAARQDLFKDDMRLVGAVGDKLTANKSWDKGKKE